MPHECLRVPEIQALMFSSLPAKDCSKVAQACTAFYEQAMNAVWADVKGLILFLLCKSLSLAAKKCRLFCGKNVEIVSLRISF